MPNMPPGVANMGLPQQTFMIGSNMPYFGMQQPTMYSHAYSGMDDLIQRTAAAANLQSLVGVQQQQQRGGAPGGAGGTRSNKSVV